MNLTQSKLAKCLHLKTGAKVIKKTNINKLNYKIMIYYNLFFKYESKKRFTFEKSFLLESTAISYANSCMQNIDLKSIIKEYKIIKSKNKRYY